MLGWYALWLLNLVVVLFLLVCVCFDFGSGIYRLWFVDSGFGGGFGVYLRVL